MGKSAAAARIVAVGRNNIKKRNDIIPIEHTADAGFIIKGETTNDLFLNAAKALCNLMEVEEIAPVKEEKITLEAPSKEELLILWLNEIIFLAEQKSIIPKDIHIIFEGNKIIVNFKPVRVTIRVEVKAATYYKVGIKKTKTGYSTDIFFDL